MSKKNWLIIVIIIILVVIMLLIKNVDQKEVELPINEQNSAQDKVDITDLITIEKELDLINVDAEIDEDMKLIDAELENL